MKKSQLIGENITDERRLRSLRRKYFRHRSSMPFVVITTFAPSLDQQQQYAPNARQSDQAQHGFFSLSKHSTITTNELYVYIYLGYFNNIGFALANRLSFSGSVTMTCTPMSILALVRLKSSSAIFAPLDDARHLLRRDRAVEGVALDEHALARALAVRLEHVDRADRVRRLALLVRRLDAQNRVDAQIRKEVALDADQLRRHRRARRVHEHVAAERRRRHAQILLDVLGRLLAR
jgi:hypothetical protein